MEHDNDDRDHVFRPVSVRCTNHNAPLHASDLTSTVYKYYFKLIPDEYCKKL